MPKIVDHEARRAELARAVWRVVQREGVAAVSVRATAQEAGWSPGTVQHYFSTRDQMLEFAMETAIAAGAGRVEPLLADDAHADGDPVTAAVGILESLAPLDGDSRVATELWVAFLARVLVDERARAIENRGADELADECRRLVTSLCHPPDDEQIEFEAVRLHALLDGVSLMAVTRPGRMPPERVREILRRHVAQIASGPAPAGSRPHGVRTAVSGPRGRSR
ncbi:Transcriptional regulator, TetR family [Pseudonocardia sp. Ae168_Ps1]|uniref:TetR/AcrR family transcriptional regulator n=1 Tax=unclassified Pseudonocardia TaxID=2619320 RepID=UPI00094AA003|nr:MULTISPECIES: TetR/AcrR family transcriptional regulator [unclassified Pseudonocardia]OLL74526.1 Transcriptional regulator, TetR family [Pseudonocardia sp. Ae150A_Ps1]OLL80505.1 Transcriptional regulator, TetR family [Pseudonocardia sp. Ae168_Ps1]OLL85367.1 Transcriptional regulator, TetR family [Pseudonocardia sp. Ae263_Ps1]OLL94606.1 Transcriptional regulator, TetR family [Pseudonocardia sp. Ae356_Ps1]